MKVLLCGHTGSKNRGCEAIVRSTVGILKRLGIDCSCVTFSEDDKKVGLDQIVELIPAPRKNKLEQLRSAVHRTILKDNIWGNAFFYKKILDSYQPDMVLNIGGDTYCYGIPWLSIALNIEAKKRNIPTVFWGCSVESEALANIMIQNDINLYSAIVTRESFSMENMNQYRKDKTTLFQACDPAFQLIMTPVALPDGFQEKNTLGINLSPVMLGKDSPQQSMVYQNTRRLIEHVIAHSDMSVCLVPHVYSVNPPSGDYTILRELYEQFKESGRVSIVDTELSCTQLKYIISKCRFFIGARTHSMIAAYSNHVPAIGLSYSIKSRGLAKDIMGAETGYAVSWKDFTEENQLIEMYESYLVQREQEILKRYADRMPMYKQSILDVAKTIFQEN